MNSLKVGGLALAELKLVQAPGPVEETDGSNLFPQSVQNCQELEQIFLHILHEFMLQKKKRKKLW